MTASELFWLIARVTPPDARRAPLLLRKPNGDKVPAVAEFDTDGTLVVREERDV